MLFLGAAIGAAAQIGTSIFGAIQANKARKRQLKMAEEQMAKANALREEAERNRVDYKAPAELEQNIEAAQADLNAGDEVIQGATEAQQGAVANTAAAAERSATSGAQALAAVQSASVEASKNIQEAEEGAAARKAAKKRALAQARAGIAGARDREYDVNVAQPYFQAISDARQYEAAALGNEEGAINTGAQNAANMTRAVGKAGDLIKNVTMQDAKNFFGGFGKNKNNE